MPICQGCGASYDDNYKFCPHCGRAKPEPEPINVNVRVAPARYEEAVLKIEVVGTTELTEPPFDWRPSGLRRALGEGGKNWTQVALLRLLLESMHPDNGRYLAYASSNFRGFVDPDLEFPSILSSRFTLEKFSASNQAHHWLLDLFDERCRCWEGFNGYLIGEGWVGMTQRATDREAPFADTPTKFINRDGNLSACFQDALMATSYHSYLRQVRSHGEQKDTLDFGESYRYQRAVA